VKEHPVPKAASLPSVDAVLRRPAIDAAVIEYGRSGVVATVRAVLEDERRARSVTSSDAHIDRGVAADRIEDEVLERLMLAAIPSLRRVFNLTGTVLHTNLGRAPLATEAIDAIVATAGDDCNLEYDVDGGGRGERDDHVMEILCRLTGAESAMVVNNNAGAVLLCLNSIANRREVIVSRGELIEIGGSFRMPDVMARSGCRLREVGTTNQTHLSDYADAIGPRTAALMKVHPSNYAISGFTTTVTEQDLVQLARGKGLPVIVDLGSGNLVDLAAFGLPREPTVAEVVGRGADLVTFSGDKLLGGPQAGLIVGRSGLIDKLRRNPLKRALRIDKVILAALAATLRLYDNHDILASRLPSLRRLKRRATEIRAMAERLAEPLQASLGDRAVVSIEPCASQVGSGSLPIDILQSWALAIRLTGAVRGSGARLNALARAFRMLPVPVIGRISKRVLMFDLRCLEDEGTFAAQLGRLSIPTDL
jgi:L-seryl-tRNA(Ser) seleniumtransferase